jgi:hypothetical protein
MADSQISGTKDNQIPELTTQPGFGGNGYLIVFG